MAFSSTRRSEGRNSSVPYKNKIIRHIVLHPINIYPQKRNMKLNRASIFVSVLVMAQLFMAEPGEAIACNQVHSSLRPCLEYLHGQRGNPPPPCCNGLNILRLINLSSKTSRLHVNV